MLISLDVLLFSECVVCDGWNLSWVMILCMCLVVVGVMELFLLMICDVVFMLILVSFVIFLIVVMCFLI